MLQNKLKFNISTTKLRSTLVSYEPLFENPVNNIGELHVQLYLNLTILEAYPPA